MFESGSFLQPAEATFRVSAVTADRVLEAPLFAAFAREQVSLHPGTLGHGKAWKTWTNR
jgi:hypothetical protein